MAIPGLKTERGSLAVVDDNWPIFLTLAAVEQQSGNGDEATRLARATLSYVQNSKAPGPVGLDHWTRAAALALLGRNDEAIVALESMTRTGNHLRWWVTLESDPIFTALRGSPRFQAFANDARVWVADQQKQVQQMRQRGDIPARAAAATANGC